MIKDAHSSGYVESGVAFSKLDARGFVGLLREHERSLKLAAIGLVLAIGSSGLLLGGVTVAISSVLVMEGFDLLSAMTIGFFATGIIGATLGLFLAVRAIRFLVWKLPFDFTS